MSGVILTAMNLYSVLSSRAASVNRSASAVAGALAVGLWLLFTRRRHPVPAPTPGYASAQTTGGGASCLPGTLADAGVTIAREIAALAIWPLLIVLWCLFDRYMGE